MFLMKQCKDVIFLMMLQFVFSCSSRDKHEHSFYYWKTRIKKHDTISDIKIKEWKLTHFYLRYFDVDWNEDIKMPVPIGDLNCYSFYRNIAAQNILNAELTPVVYITGRTFERIDNDWCDTLSLRISSRIKSISHDLEQRYIDNIVTAAIDSLHSTPKYQGEWYLSDALRKENEHFSDSLTSLYIIRFKTKIKEIQIDCDWTLKGKEKYFAFLRTFKKQNSDKKISATIRLYPYKYSKKMGVPPVDRGMLMCYNLGSVRSANTVNSIFNVDEMSKYVYHTKYKLPLDIALPIFSWYVWMGNGKFKGIIHSGDRIMKDTVTFRKINDNKYEVSKDTVVEDIYYRQGDMLRYETANSDELVKAIDVLDKNILKYGRVSFFDMDENSIKLYEKAITEIFSTH